MKYLLMGLAALTAAAVLPTPASAITCPPGTKLTVVKQKMVCMAPKGGLLVGRKLVNATKKPATPQHHGPAVRGAAKALGEGGPVGEGNWGPKPGGFKEVPKDSAGSTAGANNDAIAACRNWLQAQGNMSDNSSEIAQYEESNPGPNPCDPSMTFFLGPGGNTNTAACQKYQKAVANGGKIPVYNPCTSQGNGSGNSSVNPCSKNPHDCKPAVPH